MKPDHTDTFRAAYRASIHRHYRAWMHAGFVLAFGGLCIALFIGQLHAVQAWEWLAVPVAAVLFNFGEYTVHRQFGHHKRPLASLFYKRHTGDHHSFFVPGRLEYQQQGDWRVILFPAWLVVVFSVFAALPAWLLLGYWNANVAALFGATLLASYLAYEFVHGCSHLPERHWLRRVPGIHHMAVLHALHHERDKMQERNFNVVFPLTDLLLGTFEWPRSRADQSAGAPSARSSMKGGR